MDARETWAREAETLARIGAVLFSQPTTLTVRLPADLASAALAAWQRDHEDPTWDGDRDEVDRRTRHRAGALALIGLAVEQRGERDGEDIVVEVDAWQVGDALEAADERGLLVFEKRETR